MLQNRTELKSSPFQFFSKIFLSPKGPPFIFYFFNVTYKTGRDQRSPLSIFFGTVRLFFEIFLNVPKGSPFWLFYFATECGFINQKGSPFYNFRRYATFFEKNQKFQDFSQKNVLHFLSFRYSADFRRSRLVHNLHVLRRESEFSRWKTAIIIFRPHNLMCRRGDYNLCCIFLQVLPNLSILLPVSCWLRYGGSVRSASAYQSVDSGFESRLRLIFLTRRNISRCLAGVLLSHLERFGLKKYIDEF